MKQQLAFDFNAVHQFENNTNNQSHLEMKRDDFNEQCWTVLKRMLEGERLSYLTAINTGIGDIRRRAKDLIDSYGIPVKREWDVKDGEKQDYKVYYIAPEDRESVMKRIIDWMKN